MIQKLAAVEAECREYRRREFEAQTDLALLECFGQPEFNELYRRYAPLLNAFLMKRYTSDVRTAQLALARTWTFVAKHPARMLKGCRLSGSTVRPYLFTIAARCCMRIKEAPTATL
jgi:hypothetical protein